MVESPTQQIHINPMFGRGKADGSQRLTLEAGRGLVGDGCTSWPWTGENRWSWVCFFQTDLNKTWSSSNDLPNENYWLNPKQHWSAPSTTIAAPWGGGAGRAKKSADGCLMLFVVHCWMKRPRKRFWANRGDVNLPQFVLQSCHIFVKQSWSWNHMVYINNPLVQRDLMLIYGYVWKWGIFPNYSLI